MFQTLAKFDRQAFAAINAYGVAYRLNPKARVISATGDGPYYLYLCVLLLLLDERGETLFDAALTAFIIELPLYLVLKNSIRRTRPCHQSLPGGDSLMLTFEPSDKFSLPSGHTAAAFVMASAIAWCYPTFAWLAFAWATAIGVSRIILGVHYPLDILAGALLGVTSCYLALPLVGQ
ncbi:phosphatase PAP2 family protein [Shewanella aegiceratis]|uniref:phosphatase PAP2 family protein n=1 Tax=Shewanella aegiceratis TaxID=2864203 RepID=UPI001C657A31|nr:phosphatase PAP2 family protein [Shewanella aegiceratis]QYJ82006.1 phosphatase PAP2 family protein [Shewanella aegiceratis]